MLVQLVVADGSNSMLKVKKKPKKKVKKVVNTSGEYEI